MRSFIISVFLGAAAANPILPELQGRGAAKSTPFCATVTNAVTSLKQQAAATAYCSSYLSIPLATTKTTVGGGVTTTTISSDTSTSTVTTVSTCLVPSAGSKLKPRGASKPKPGCFAKYSTGPLISSACKCLSVPTSTTTITVQGGPGSTATVNLGTTSTSASTVYARPALESQQVYAYAPGRPAVNGHFVFGPYFGEQGQDRSGGEQYGFPTYRSCCASYTILDNGNLRVNGNPGGILYQNAGDPRVRVKLAGDLTAADVPLVCSYRGEADGTCPMTCTGVNGNQNNADADLWRLNSVPGGFQLYALPGNA